MSWNFPLILLLLVIITGVLSLIDILFFAKHRRQNQAKQPVIFEYARSFFPVFFLVWIIRSFIVQPFHVPTGSLEPTVLPGELLAVNQFTYGLRFPVLDKKMVSIHNPQRGDIVVFRWPVNPRIDFVKRVVGLPGDHIVYKNKVLYVNDKEATQTLIGKGVDVEPGRNDVEVDRYEEDLDGIKHAIFINPNIYSDDIDVIVPADSYFMMGDNRDDSGDSRIWGFVPDANLIGKVFLIWMSWDSQTHSVRWHRIGTVI